MVPQDSHHSAEQLRQLINDAQHIVVIQADNPDGDSLGSSIALENILGDMGKNVTMYCGVAIPGYLSYFAGWDRVVSELPHTFDLSIVVDTSAESLLENLALRGELQWLKTKPCIVIDHHATEATIQFAQVIYNVPAVATGEILFDLASDNNWPLSAQACDSLASSIMSDSLGLTSEATTAHSIEVIAELVKKGVKLAALEAKRRENMRKSPEIVHYKGALLQRVEYASDNRIASITIPWQEIEKYSQEYNPSVLVLDDMRLTINTDVAIAFKTYPDGKVTGKIRCNYGKAIGRQLAEHFGGGGHPYASGFKITDGRPFNEIKSECIAYAAQLLDNLVKEDSDETVQHTDQTS